MPKLNPKARERLALVHWGTKPCSLSPGAVLAAAQAAVGKRKKTARFCRRLLRLRADAAADVVGEAVPPADDPAAETPEPSV